MASSGAGERKLGRYHLVEPIGGGPTGEVYRAKVYGVAGFERQFAVKRFHPELVKDPQQAHEVARAARIYGNLEHPRIARLHEFGVASGETFAATEMVEGIDLTRLVSSSHGVGQALLPGAALSIVVQIGRAVGYAHGRGICHLGLCPTNVICTPDGEVKVTDFGFLPPRIPARPADDFTLLARLPYLAAEQLLQEEVSPATDVFQLGTIMYELLTGRRPFTGPTPLDISQAILSSAPPDPPVTKEVVKVVRRALARSPFERFPDASAMADEIEAAVRASPLPGARREISSVVRTTMDAIEELGASNASGAFAFPLPAPPTGNTPLAKILKNPRPAVVETGKVGAMTLPEGLSPKQTFMGMSSAPPPVPAVPATIPVPVLASPPPIPAAQQQLDEDAPTDIRLSPEDSVSGATAPARSPTMALGSEPHLDPKPAAQVPSVVPSPSLATSPGPATEPVVVPAPGASSELVSTAEVEAACFPPPPSPELMPGQEPASVRTGKVRTAVFAVLAVVVLGVGGWFAYDTFLADQESTVARQEDAPPAQVATADTDAAAAAVVTGPIVPQPADAGAAAVGAADATADSEDDTNTVTDTLRITTTPPGAHVYIDGAEVGVTPLEREGTDDSFRLALISTGHKLYVSDIRGDQQLHIEMEEVSPPGGPAGIKVRCKKKDRYYVFVDGHDSGQLCPTERLGVSIGTHMVEIYDPVTDSRQRYHADVKETRISLRVRVD